MAHLFGGRRQGPTPTVKRGWLLSFLLALAIVAGLVPGACLPAYATDTTLKIAKEANPATIVETAEVLSGYNKIDLSKNVELKSATGSVSYKIVDEEQVLRDYDCELNGSVFSSGCPTETVTVKVNVTIAADDHYEALTKTITVTIVSIPVTNIVVEPAATTMRVGEDLRLKVKYTPENATDKDYTTEGYDQSIVDVDGAGYVYALAPGTTTITVRATNGTVDKTDDVTATCAVTVVKPKVPYAATAGDGSTWAKGSTDGLEFTFKRTAEGEEKDTTFSHFKSASVDGKELTKDDDYTAAEGSIVVTLTPAYLEALSAGEHELTATFDDGSATAKFTVTDAERDYPAPAMTNSKKGSFVSTRDEVAFTVTQEVPEWATSVKTWVDVEPVLALVHGSDDVAVTCDGNVVEGAAVTVDGQRVTVEIADATALRGKSFQFSYRAKVKDGADLSAYLNPAKNVASVPYQAHTIFDGEEDNVVASTREAVTFRVGSSGGTASTGSSGGTASTGSTASTRSNTLAKTGDVTSLAGVAAMAATGAGAVLAGRRRRR